MRILGNENMDLAVLPVMVMSREIGRKEGECMKHRTNTSAAVNALSSSVLGSSYTLPPGIRTSVPEDDSIS